MYFAVPGPENTEDTVKIALNAARAGNIKHIVFASSTGFTAGYLRQSGLNAVCVRHAYGFGEKGKNQMTDEMRADLESAGIKVVTATHVLSGVERGISNKSGGMYPVEVMANTLRMFGQGTKVCVEISTMALDAGAIPHGEKVIAIGGSGWGADTALIITPAHANDIFSAKIHEYLCKPLG